jgi:hypothetical protein
MRDGPSSGVSVVDRVPSITLEFADNASLETVAKVSRLLMCADSFALLRYNAVAVKLTNICKKMQCTVCSSRLPLLCASSSVAAVVWCTVVVCANYCL